MPISLLAPARALKHLGKTAAALAVAALVASSVVFVASPASAATNIGGNSAEIVVNTGGLRTGTGNADIGGLDGVHLELWNGNGSPGSKINAAWADCFSVSGQCVFTVPNGEISNTRFWIKQGTSLAGSPAAQNYSANPSLVTALDNSGFGVDPYQYRTNQIGDSTRNVSGVDFMVLSGDNAVDVSSGYWQNSYKNPAAQSKCGLNIAVLADLSSSVNAAALTDLKNAATAFVNALTGTPSTISLYTFGTTAPAPGANNSSLLNQSALNAAQMTALKNKISGLTVPNSSYTNWDAGLWQLRNGGFDQIIVITDGNPTAYNADSTTSGVDTRFNEIERAIFSANVLKSQGMRIVTVGVGSNFEGGENLKAMSGPVANSDYFTGDWASLSTTLSNIAAANCGGSVTIVKKVIPWGGTVATSVATGGWTMNASVPAGVSLDQSQAITAANNGAVNFKLSNVPVAGTVFTGSEVQQGGFTLTQQSSKNAVCTKTGGASVTVTNSGALGFTVPVGPSDVVTCTIYNQAPQPNATVTVNKQWVVNGTALPLNQFPTGYTAEVTGTATSWGVAKQIPVGTVTVGETNVVVPGEYCTVDSRKVTAFNATVVDVNIASSSYTSPALVAGSSNTITVTNTVTCTSKLKLVKTVVNDNGGTATPANWTLQYGSTGVTSGTTSVVAPGSYVLTEVGLAGSAGYAPSASNPLTCTTGLSGSTVTVPMATTVTCTFVNDDIAPTLKLVKVVSGADGVTADNWTLTAKDGGTTAVTGAGVTAVTPVKANVNYTLAEAATGSYATDFTASAWSCVDATGAVTVTAGVLAKLVPGQNVVCTITNTAKATDPIVTKTAGAATQNADGTWSVVYTVTVTNPNKYAGITYDLADTLAFGGTITIVSATATGPSPQAPSWSAVNHVLADDVALGANASHVYTVTTKASVPNGAPASVTACPTGPGAGGFLNTALLTVAGKDYSANACVAPVKPTFQKDPGTVTNNGNGTWTVTYTLKATNSTGTDLFYSLTDDPQATFPSGATVTAGTVTPAGAYPGYASSWNPAASGKNTTIVASQSLPKNSSQTFTISLTVTISSAVTPAALTCTAPGSGLVNSATLTSGNQVIVDDACLSVPLPTITHSKVVTSNTQNADGTWTVVYTVAVTNTGTVSGVYSLTDTPKLTVAGKISIVGTPTATGPAGSQAGSWNGGSNQTLATNLPIAAGATQNYVVTVVASVAKGVTGTPAALCAPNGTNGFLNAASLTAGGSTVEKTACAEPVKPLFQKDPGTATQQPDGTWKVTYSLTVTNPSRVSAVVYSIDDAPVLQAGVTQTGPATVTPAGNPAWTGMAPNTNLVTAATLAASAPSGDLRTKVYTITVPVAVAPSAAIAQSSCDLGTPGIPIVNGATLASGNETISDDACVSIPLPTITHTKTEISTQMLSSGDWQIVYDVVVSNPGLIAGTYSLTDVPQLPVGAAITLVSASATLNAAPVAGFDGTSITTLATDRLLAAGATETYRVTVVADVAAGATGTADALCSAQDATSGFNNVATLTVSGTSTTAEDCSSPTLPKFAKSFVEAVPAGANTWNVKFELTADNSAAGSKAVWYTLSDLPGFPPGVDVNSVSVSGFAQALPGTAVELPAGAIHTYTIVVNATVPAGLPSGDLTCTGQPGAGFFNAATLTVGNDALPDADCGPIRESVVPVIQKSIVDGYPKQVADGSWTIRYSVTVSADSDLEAVYDLSDTLGFGAGFVVNSAAVTSAPVTTDPTWDGTAAHSSIAKDVTLPAGDVVHTYTIEVNASVPAASFASGATACLTGELPAPGGFLNTAKLTSGSAAPRYAWDCDSPALPTITKEVDPANPPALQDDGSYLVTYLVKVSNGSDLELSYDLTDELGFVEGVTVSDAKVTGPGALDDWNGQFKLTVASGQPLAKQSTATYTITLKATPTAELELDDVQCDAEEGAGHGLFNLATLTSGDSVTNEDACAELPLARLTLVKQVDNDAFDGLDLGDDKVADAGDWVLEADSEDAALQGRTGTTDVTSVLVPAGNYSLSEQADPDSGTTLIDYYTAGDWECGNAELEGDDVTVAVGSDVTCEITNTGEPVDLKITKTDGGDIPTEQGSTYRYTFVIENQGGIDAHDVVVTDEIPATIAVDLDFVVMPAGWVGTLEGAVDGFGGTLVLSRAAVFPAGASATFVFDVTTAATLPRANGDPAGKILDIVNTAIVTSSGVEATPEDNTSTEVTPVRSLGVAIQGVCTKNAPYASWSLTPWNTESLPQQEIVVIWWTPAAFDARDASIPASNTAAILADGALKVTPITAPAGGWITGETVTGTTLWAGASVSQNGVGNGWPGWKLVGETWVLDPSSQYYPVRDGAVVELRMNPSSASAILYPTAVYCGPFELPTFPLTELAFTGAAGVGGLLLFANGLVAFGILAAAYRKRSAHRAG